MARKPASEQTNTLEDIRDAAFGLFGRHGYDGVSLAKVADAAGITKAAIYWHYDDKLDLYTDCTRQFYAMFRRYIFEAMGARERPAAKVMALFEGTGRLLQDPRIEDGVAGFWLDAKTTDLGAVRDLQVEFEDTARDLLAAIIEDGMEQGEFDLVIPAQQMAQGIISLVVASVLPLRNKTKEQTTSLLRALAHTFFRAHGLEERYAAEALFIGDGDGDDPGETQG